MTVFTFKNIRIFILLCILAYAAIYTQGQKLSTLYWYKPIVVTIFPINGDGKVETDNYIANLTTADFSDIDSFFTKNAKQFGLITEQPFITSLGDVIQAHPPSPPKDRSAMLQVITWSMKLRYWAYKYTPDSISNENRVRLYVLYHQGSDNQPLQHSLGLQKGLIGVVHAFADPKQNPQNNIVMTHEIMHTVGATDKYGAANMPRYPDGYAEPDKSPLFPQRYAEIMVGRVAISETEAKMPKSLKQVRVGDTTAKEINWIKQGE